VIEVELFEKLTLYDMYDDRIQREYWEELGKSEQEVIPDIWYDFDIKVKGSYIIVNIDDIPWVFTDVLSSRRGGFEISVSNLEESDFSIAFKDFRVKFTRLD
jgi:hypothetical protein